MDERPLTVAQFAERFGLPLSTAYLAVKRGEVRHLKIGRRKMIPAREALAFEQRSLMAGDGEAVPA